MKVLLIASILLVLCFYGAEGGWTCTTGELKGERSFELTLAGDRYLLQQMYVGGFLGFVYGAFSWQVACPAFPAIYGGTTSIDLGDWGKTTVDRHGHSESVSDHLESVVIFNAGKDNEFRIVYVCVALIENAVLIYQKEKTDTDIAVALEAIKDAGIEIGSKQICG